MPHLDAAYRFARWLARSPDDADDLVQDAILRAFRGSNVKAWLLTIVRNCYSTSLKRRQWDSLQPLPEDNEIPESHSLVAEDPGPESIAILADERRSLEQMMQALPAEYREILMLREIEDMGYREIAQVIGAPMGTVMSRLARARAALKKHWLLQQEGKAHAAP